MKAPDFDYARPATLDEALALLAAHGDEARPLAGGQSLMATLNLRLSEPALLVDINRLPGLAGIEDRGEHVLIGALTRHVEVEHSAVIAEHLPLLRAAMPHVAHPAIRNRGTVGGSLALADPAAELPACCLTLGATLIVRGRDGERRVRAADFFHGLFETAVGADELLTGIELPKAGAGYRSAFAELARRHGDYAIVGACAHGRFDGAFDDVRLTFFGVGDRPLAASTAAIQGQGVDAIARLREAVMDELEPDGDLHATPQMKRHLAGVLSERLLRQLAEAP